MSRFDSDDSEMPGYFLPEDSQLRLKKLRQYVEFLSHLAQPRMADEQQECMPQIRAGEVAVCLEMLAEQLERVLDDVSWPADRCDEKAAPGAGTVPEAAEETPDDVEGRCIFGVTLEQVDTLGRLIDMILAHGDVVTASGDLAFADHTLSLLRDAISNDARAARQIIRQVESQKLGRTRGPHTGVGEERGAYRAGRAHSRAGSASHVARALLATRNEAGPGIGSAQCVRVGRSWRSGTIAKFPGRGAVDPAIRPGPGFARRRSGLRPTKSGSNTTRRG